jgi:hypothetical protein
MLLNSGCVLQLQIQLESTAIEQAEQLAGWRLYVTNAPLH